MYDLNWSIARWAIASLVATDSSILYKYKSTFFYVFAQLEIKLLPLYRSPITYHCWVSRGHIHTTHICISNRSLLTTWGQTNVVHKTLHIIKLLYINSGIHTICTVQQLAIKIPPPHVWDLKLVMTLYRVFFGDYQNRHFCHFLWPLMILKKVLQVR